MLNLYASYNYYIKKGPLFTNMGRFIDIIVSKAFFRSIYHQKDHISQT